VARSSTLGGAIASGAADVGAGGCGAAVGIAAALDPVRLGAGGVCDAAATGAFADGVALFTDSAARFDCVV
jgi:hypothetical protein